jgi:hypothetical protein
MNSVEVSRGITAGKILDAVKAGNWIEAMKQLRSYRYWELIESQDAPFFLLTNAKHEIENLVKMKKAYGRILYVNSLLLKVDDRLAATKQLKLDLAS